MGNETPAGIVERLRARARYCRDLDSESGDAREFEVAAEEMDRIYTELHAVKYEVMGGEDVPGSASAATVEDVRAEISRLVRNHIVAEAEIERLRAEKVVHVEDLRREICAIKDELNDLALLGVKPMWGSLIGRLDDLLNAFDAASPVPQNGESE